MMLITLLGEEPVVLIAAALFGFVSYVRSGEYLTGIIPGVAGIISIVSNRVAKRVFMSPRPPLRYMVIPLADPGFPSAHAMNSLSVYGAIAYLAICNHGLSVRQRYALSTAIAFAIAAVGLSRIYLGEHWLSDVLGGWAFGAVLLVLVALLHRVVLLHHNIIYKHPC
jgi:undecaprenyl-diphosphatase